ncbi:MAG: TatD family hydrolase [bacterium]|nr:TatD family hydrolase [bacterium]
MLIDTHCHLDFPKLGDQLEDVLARAEEANIKQMVTICTKVRQFDEVVSIAENHDNIFCSVGTHPHYAQDELDISVKEIIALSQRPKVVAIGETGLDYHYDNSPRDEQQTVFRRHIDVARRTGLPLIIHTRDADEDTVSILKEEMAIGAFPALIHCFTASRQLAEEVLDLGLYISMSGVLTFNNSVDLQGIAKNLPLDRLLVETDAPFLAPMPHRGKTNEPAFTVHTAQKLADLQQRSLEEVAAATTANFYRLFTKAPKLEDPFESTHI